jgi:hypothetical protein
MQRGYMQGFEVFAREASELLVNRRSNEVVNIASTEMMKKWLAGSIRHCEEHLRRSNPVLHVWLWIASSLRSSQ